MDSLLFAREAGGFIGNKQAHAASIQHSIGNSEALMRRLTNHKHLHIAAGGSRGALCCSWDDAGVQLALGTDTCQLQIYNADKGRFTHTFDPGHTEGIACAEFLPGSNGRLLVTAGPTRDIRVIDLERQAVRQFSGHAATVRSILPLSQAVFASGGEDGTICCFDSRARDSRDNSSQGNSRSLLVDQRHESGALLGGKPSVQSMSQDPLNTQYIATGGGDAFVRVYDVRMMRQPSGAQLGYSRSRPPPWCSCLAPLHMRGGSDATRLLRTSNSISSITYDSTGRRLLACYTGEGVYSFDVMQHSFSYDQLMNAQQQQRYGRRQRGQQPPWLQGGVQQQLQDNAAAVAVGSGRRALRGRRMMAGVWQGDAGGQSHPAGQAPAAAAAAAAHQAGSAAAAGPAASVLGAAGAAAGAARRPHARRTVRPTRSTRSRQVAAAAAGSGAAQQPAALEGAAAQAAPGSTASVVDRVRQVTERLEQLQQGFRGIQQQLPLSTGSAPATANMRGDGGVDRRSTSSTGGEESEGPPSLIAGSDSDAGSSGSDADDSGSAGDADDGDEFMLTAEVQLVGPDGTVLHRTSIPISGDHRILTGAADHDDEELTGAGGNAQQQQQQHDQHVMELEQQQHQEPQHSLFGASLYRQQLQLLQHQLTQAAGAAEGSLGQAPSAPAAAADNAATAQNPMLSAAADQQALEQQQQQSEQQQPQDHRHQQEAAQQDFTTAATEAAAAAALEQRRAARRLRRSARAAAAAAAESVAPAEELLEQQEQQQQQRQTSHRTTAAAVQAADPLALTNSAGLAAAAAGPTANGQQRPSRSRRAAAATASSGRRAGSSSSHSRARRLNGIMFMGLGGDGAGSTQNIADMSPSVAERLEGFMRSQAAAAAWPEYGPLALSGSQQQQQQYHERDAGEPAFKRVRRELSQAAASPTGAAGTAAAAAAAAGDLDSSGHCAAAPAVASGAADPYAPEQCPGVMNPALAEAGAAAGLVQHSSILEAGAHAANAGAGAVDDSHAAAGLAVRTRRQTARRFHPFSGLRNTSGQQHPQQQQQQSTPASAQQGSEAAGAAGAAAPGWTAAPAAAQAAVSGVGGSTGMAAAATAAHNTTHAALQGALGAALGRGVAHSRSAMYMPAGPDGPVISVHQFAMPLSSLLQPGGGALRGLASPAAVALRPAQQPGAGDAAAAGQLREQRLGEVLQRSMQREAAQLAQRPAAAAAGTHPGPSRAAAPAIAEEQQASARILRPSLRPPASPAAAGAQQQLGVPLVNHPAATFRPVFRSAGSSALNATQSVAASGRELPAHIAVRATPERQHLVQELEQARQLLLLHQMERQRLRQQEQMLQHTLDQLRQEQQVRERRLQEQEQPSQLQTGLQQARLRQQRLQTELEQAQPRQQLGRVQTRQQMELVQQEEQDLQQEREQLQQQDLQQRAGGLAGVDGPMHALLGAMTDVATAAGAAAGDHEFEFTMSIDAAAPIQQRLSPGSRHGSRVPAGAAAAAPIAAAGSGAAASSDRLPHLQQHQEQRDAGAAAMLRAELVLPQQCRQDVERQLMRQRQHKRWEQQQQQSPIQDAVADASFINVVQGETAGSQQAAAAELGAVAEDAAAGDMQMPGHVIHATADGSAKQRVLQTGQQQQQSLQAEQAAEQQVEQETAEEVQHRLRRSKRKRRSSGHDAGAAAAAPAEVAEVPAGSDAAYVAALSGVSVAGRGTAAATAALQDVTGTETAGPRRSSRRAGSSTQAAAAAAPDVVASAAAASARQRRGRQAVIQATAAAAAAAAAAPSLSGGGCDDNDSSNGEPQESREIDCELLDFEPGSHAGPDDGSGDGHHSAGSPPQLHLDYDYELNAAEDDHRQIPWQRTAAAGAGPNPAAAAAAAAAARTRVGAAGDDYEPDEYDDAAEQDDEASAAARGYSRCFRGHSNMLSGRNAAWLGSHGQYIVSGSDDGCLYVWRADTGELVTVLRGGDKAVRRVQVNPHQLLLASCAAEPTVRLWSPVADIAVDPAHVAAAAAATAVNRHSTEDEQHDVDRRAAVGGLAGMLRQIGERLVWGLLGGRGEDREGGSDGEDGNVGGADDDADGAAAQERAEGTAAAAAAAAARRRGRRERASGRDGQHRQQQEVGSGGSSRSSRGAARAAAAAAAAPAVGVHGNVQVAVQQHQQQQQAPQARSAGRSTRSAGIGQQQQTPGASGSAVGAAGVSAPGDAAGAVGTSMAAAGSFDPLGMEQGPDRMRAELAATGVPAGTAAAAGAAIMPSDVVAAVMGPAAGMMSGMMNGLMGGMLESMGVDMVAPQGVQMLAQQQQQQQGAVPRIMQPAQQLHILPGAMQPGVGQQLAGMMEPGTMHLPFGLQEGVIPLADAMQPEFTGGMLQQGFAPGAVEPVMGQPAMTPLVGGQMLFPGPQVPHAAQQQQQQQADGRERLGASSEPHQGNDGDGTA